MVFEPLDTETIARLLYFRLTEVVLSSNKKKQRIPRFVPRAFFQCSSFFVPAIPSKILPAYLHHCPFGLSLFCVARNMFASSPRVVVSKGDARYEVSSPLLKKKQPRKAIGQFIQTKRPNMVCPQLLQIFCYAYSKHFCIKENGKRKPGRTHCR